MMKNKDKNKELIFLLGVITILAALTFAVSCYVEKVNVNLFEPEDNNQTISK